MATKIVDVFLKDVLVRSYELAWDIVHAPLYDHDFIDRARQRMREDDFTNQEIGEARFSLRD